MLNNALGGLIDVAGVPLSTVFVVLNFVGEPVHALNLVRELVDVRVKNIWA